MANGTIHKLGTLYVSGSKIKRPTRPWTTDDIPDGASEKGNIFEYSGGNIEIRNTDSDDEYKLQWIEVNDNGKKLLICDRNIMTRASWDNLNAQGLVNGKEITIDGQKYNIRLLSGGSNYRSGSDNYSGGSPTDNEWDRIIVNESNFSGIPIPSNTDLDEDLDSDDYSSPHNKVWNWFYCYSWCKEVYSESSSARVGRGCYSACYFYASSSGDRGDTVGWRPVLEILNSAPTISDSDRDLGEFTSEFTKEYTINDSDGDKLNVTEKVNNETINSMTNLNSGSIIAFSIKNKWSELSTGKHTITIEVDDRNGGITTRKWTFTKIDDSPSISINDENLGILFFPLIKQYRISSPINEPMTVTERINGEVIRTLQNQPSGTDLTLDTSTIWNELEPKEHNIEIEVTTTSGKSSLKVLTFAKSKVVNKKLGTLYVNGSKIKRPTRPWMIDSTPSGASEKGNIYDYSSNSGNIEIRNTDSDDTYKLQWIEVNDNGKKLLICDRNILARVSWGDLNAQGFVNGKEITIDGQKYKIRLLSGGSNYRNSGDNYSGGSPTDNEWDRIIVNEGNFSGIPIPKNTDLDEDLDSTDYSSSHNKLWNWAGMYSWCKEVYSGDSNSRVVHGCYSARYFGYGSSGVRINSVGWRPALEILNSAPTISDSDRDFGDFASPFIKTYTITDSDNDKIKVVEKINGDIIRTLEDQTSGTELTLDLTSKWKDLSIDKHTITIEIDDGYGGVATRKWTFTKKNSTPEKPTILYPKNNMRAKEEFYVRFTIGKDAEGDPQEVKIQVADNDKFSSNLKEFAEGLEKNVGGSWVSHNGDITDADIGNEFRISVKTTNNTTKYIRVATKDKTSGATEFSDLEEIKIGDKLKFETIPQTLDFKPYAISIVDKKEVDSNATIRVYACNNALDTDKTWEDITEEYLKDNYYPFKNNNKESDDWAVSIKYEIEANDATGEVSIDAIGIGVI